MVGKREAGTRPRASTSRTCRASQFFRLSFNGSAGAPRDTKYEAGAKLEDLIDRDYYLAKYHDVRRSGMDPSEHYLTKGAALGYNPHPLFHTRFYLSQNEDVRKSGVNPLFHFLHSGAWEGRAPNPVFDCSFYLKQYPDVAASRVNPLLHYLRVGAKQGRDPNPLFSTNEYIRQYPDAAGMNPLVHYFRDTAPSPAPRQPRGKSRGRFEQANRVGFVSSAAHPNRKQCGEGLDTPTGHLLESCARLSSPGRKRLPDFPHAQMAGAARLQSDPPHCPSAGRAGFRRTGSPTRRGVFRSRGLR